MKTFQRPLASALLLAVFLLSGWLGAPSARAGVTINLTADYDNNAGSPYYILFVSLATNNLTDNPPDTFYYLWSTNGSLNSGVHAQVDWTNSNANNVGVGYGDWGSFIGDVTNTWTLTTVTGTLTNAYFFNFSFFPSNELPNVQVTYPQNNAAGVPPSPTFTWTPGPTNYTQLYAQVNSPDYSVAYDSYLDLTSTSWEAGTPLEVGSNYNFFVVYNNFSTSVVASTPMDASSNAFTDGWQSAAEFSTYDSANFQVGAPNPAPGHFLVAQYTFDDTNDLNHDSSQEQNSIDCSSGWGDQGHQPDTNSVDGGAAVRFFGLSNITPCYRSFLDWEAALLGSFSVSAWINTTNLVGSDDGDIGGYGSGQAVILMDENTTIPIGITGSKLAFATSDGNGNMQTIHSAAPVTTGQYVHVVVTRDAPSGIEKIYINGVLDTVGAGLQGRLGTEATQVEMGSDYWMPYAGLLDEVQLYRGVLQDSDVAALYANPEATIPDVMTVLPGTLVAHYTFNDTNHLGLDSSGNIFDFNFADDPNLNFGNQGAYSEFPTNDAVEGGSAINFTGGGFLSYETTPPEILNTFGGDYSLAAWIKTTNQFDSDGDPAYFGAGIVSADVPGVYNDYIPLAQTGGEAATFTGNPDTTVNSTVDINDGNWRHVVVTRQASSGLMQIYIDGALNASGNGPAGFLGDPRLVTVGALADASQISPDNCGPYYNYVGFLDDLQIYDTVLSPSDVNTLYNNPGKTVGQSAVDFNFALNTTNLIYDTTGDSPWTTESQVSLDGFAAQSGVVTNSQTTTLSTTIAGPCQVYFTWMTSNTAAGNYYFGIEFDLDGNNADNMSGDNDWTTSGPYYLLDNNSHSFSWTASANGSTDPGGVAYLDQIAITNIYPPYPVDMTANGSSVGLGYPTINVPLGSNLTMAVLFHANPPATNQWYKNGQRLDGETNATLTLTDVQFSDAAQYRFVAINSLGALEEDPIVKVYKPTDLIPVSITYPAVVSSDSMVPFQWTVTNTGPGDVSDVFDYVNFTSPVGYPYFSQSTAVAYREPAFVPGGSSYTVSNLFRFPNIGGGTYTLILDVNADQNVVEPTGNNQLTGPQITVLNPDMEPGNFSINVTTNVGGGYVTATYNITNNGPGILDGATWYDNLYISSNPTLDTNAISLQTIAGSGTRHPSLGVGQFYTTNLFALIPTVPSGDYYIILKLDDFGFGASGQTINYIWEANEANNTASVPVHILEPDLAPTNLDSPASASANQSLIVDYQVVNQGDTTAAYGGIDGWFDNVYISPTNILDGSAQSLRASGDPIRFMGSLAPGEYYSNSVAVTIPNMKAGNYFLLVDSDTDGMIHENNKANNVLAKPIQVLNGDLEPIAFSCPPGGIANSNITVTYTITNVGAGALIPEIGYWYDTIAISTSPTYDETSAGWIIVSQVATNALPPGGSYTVTKTVPVPNYAEGSYYLFIVANAYNTFYAYESDYTNNALGAPFSIATPALVMTRMTNFQTTLSSQEPIDPTYVVSNASPVTAAGGWADRIYLSPNGVVDYHSYLLSGGGVSAFTHSTALAFGASYTNDFPVNIPAVPGGDYYLIGDADADGYFAEPSDAANQYSVMVHVQNPDLAVTNFDVPASVSITSIDQALGLDWTVENVGPGTLYLNGPYWLDNIYISPTNVLDSNATALAYVTEGQTLYLGDIYTGSATVTLPNFISGNYYLLVDANHYGSIYETNHANNLLAQPIQITIPNLPILGAQNVTSPPSALAGQNVLVSWTLTNSGNGDVNGSFTDRVYLGTDAAGDNPTYYGDLPFSGTIPAHSSVTRQLSIYLPLNLHGTFYAGVHADLNQQIFQFTNRPNELVFSGSPMVVSLSTADLAATSVAVYTNTLASQERISPIYSVSNVSAQVAPAGWIDRLYLSSNGVVDSHSIKLAGAFGVTDFSQNFVLNPGAAYTNLLNVTIPGVPAGDYSIIADADATQIFNEPNFANNLFSFPVHILNPDLAATNFEVPSSVSITQYNQAVDVDWTAVNQGEGIVYAPSWSDDIYISRTNVYDSTAVEVGGQGQNFELLPGEAYNGFARAQIPNFIQGAYYLLLEVDDGGGVYETVKTNNVIAKPLNIVIPPLPILGLLTVSASPDAWSGAQLEVSWLLTNSGPGDLSGSFSDNIYLCTDANGGGAQYFGNFPFTGTIPSHSSVLRHQLITLPISMQGTFWAEVRADQGGQIFQYTNHANELVVATDPTLIHLTPVPDLAVIKVQAATNDFSSEQVLVSWIVTNAGAGPTRAPYWFDSVYLSASTNFDDAAYWTYMGSAANASFLAPGDAYSNTILTTMPLGLNGTFYFVVRTDDGNYVYETNKDDNILASAPVFVNLTETPDLRVTAVVPPHSAFSGQPVTVSFTITNFGLGQTRPTESNWTDAVYYSTNDVFDTSATLLGTTPHVGGLTPGQGYATNTTVNLPVGRYGQFYFYAVADLFNNVFEGAFEDNNTTIAAYPTTVNLTPPPDLVPGFTSVPSTALASHGLTVSYSVTNIGLTAPPNTGWADELYMSTNSAYDNTATPLGTAFVSPGNLQPGSSYSAQIGVTLSDTITGDYYLYLYTDPYKQVFELNRTNNVVRSPNPVHIQSLPPDIAPLYLTSPPHVNIASTMLISWGVTNQGLGDTANTHWNDRLILSHNPILGSSSDLILQTSAGADGIPYNSLLPAPGFYSVSNAVFAVPGSVVPGSYYLFLVADYNQTLYEGTNKGNNVFGPVPITVTADTADLQIAAATAPIGASACTNVTVSYTVTNAGDLPPSSSFWYDAIYLSSTGIIDNDARLLAYIQNKTNLLPGQSYSQTVPVSLPITTNGTYYVTVVADYFNFVSEPGLKGNNAEVIEPPMVAAPCPAADLVATNLIVPTTADEGESLTLTWTVTNVGGATANGRGNNWYDAVYLSLEQAFAPYQDIFLGYTYSPSNVLAPGQSYTRIASFPIPEGLAGPYYVVVDASHNRAVDERGSYLNNLAISSQAVEIELLPPVDLVAGVMTIPANAGAGQAATITYTVKNNGSNAALGQWSDSVYIASATNYVVGDPLFATVDHIGDLAPGSTYTNTVNGLLPGLAPGNYYVIIRSDIRNHLGEGDNPDKVAASLTSVAVTVPQLTLGVPSTGSLSTGLAAYYSFYATNGQTIHLKLTSSASLANDQLFVKFGGIPDSGAFDFAANDPFVASPEIFMPIANSGTYYVTLTSTYSPAANNYSLLAESLPFTVAVVQPQLAGNGRQTTFAIEGADFDNNTTFRLVKETSEFPAFNVQIVDSSHAYATIILGAAPLGSYDMQAVEYLNQANQVITTLPNAVAVEDPTGPIADVSINGPLVVPSGTQITASTVLYGNSGDEDQDSPLIVVVGEEGTVIGLERNNLHTNVIHMLGRSLTGPSAIIRPQLEDSFITYAAAPFHTTVYTVTSDDQLPLGESDWNTIEGAIRPFGMSDADWINFWSSIKPRIQPTWGGYVTFLQTIFAGLPPEVRDARYVMGSLYTNSPYYIPSRTFSGTLLGANDGLPQAGVQVALMSTTGPSGAQLGGVAVTDQDGQFSISFVAPGLYTAVVTNAFWDMDRDGVGDSGPPTFNLTAGSDMTGVNLYLLQTPLPAHLNSDQDPTLVEDNQGYLHAFWRHNGMIFHSWLNNGAWVDTAAISSNQTIASFTVAAGSNLVDSASPGLIAAWTQVNPTNGGDLVYSVGIRTNGTFAWSDPLTVVSDPEQNTDASIVVTRSGLALVSYLKRGVGAPDDTDVYYNIVDVTSGSLVWSNYTAANALAMPLDTIGVGGSGTLSLMYQNQYNFFAMGYLMAIGFNVSVDGQAGGCDASATAKAGVFLDAQTEEYGAKFSGELSGKYEWHIDNDECAYIFKDANINAQVALDVTYKDAVINAIKGTGDLMTRAGFILPGTAVKIAGISADRAIKIARQNGLLIDNNLIVHGDLKFLGLNWKKNPPLEHMTMPDSLSEAQVEVSAALEFTARLAGKYDYYPADMVSSRHVLPTDTFNDQTPSFAAGGKMGIIYQVYPIQGIKESYVEVSFKLIFPPFLTTPLLSIKLTNTFNPVFNPLAGWGNSSAPTTAPNDTNDDPQLVFDPSAGIGTGAVYGPNAVLSTVATDLYFDGAPSVALDGSGTPFQAWYKYENPSNMIGSQVYVADYNGRGWNAPVIIPDSLGFNWDVTAMTDRLNKRIVIWEHADASGITTNMTESEYYAIHNQSDVVYSVFDGATWSAPRSVASTPGPDSGLNMSSLPNGNLMAVWVYTDGSAVNHLMTSSWDGNLWTSAQEITAGSIISPTAREHAGSVYVLWDSIVTTNGDESVYGAVQTGGVWSKAAPFDSVGALAAPQHASFVTARDDSQNQSLISRFLLMLPYQRTACCKCQGVTTRSTTLTTVGGCGYSLVYFDEANCHKDYTYKPCVAPPHDPNEIIGPIGFGPDQWVWAGTNLSYTIDFENDPTNAEAPAQTVSITMPLDPSFDIRTFRLGAFGFGGMVFTPTANSAFYQTNIDLTASLGYFVQVAAGIDVLNNQAFWDFTTIDPLTGDVPLNPFLGFLPRDTNSPNGEGFVSCSIQPLSSATLGTTVAEQATIVFNGQPPMSTGYTSNKLEVGAPASAVMPLPAVEPSPTFTVSWDGVSVPGGDGVATFDIYVSNDRSNYVSWLEGTPLKSIQFVGDPGSAYSFYSIAHDNSGNIQPTPTVPDATTYVSSNSPPSINPITNLLVAPDGVARTTISATDVNGDKVTFSLATAPTGAAINPTNGQFIWHPGRANASTTNLITVTATDNGAPPMSTNESFYVVVEDYLDITVGSTNVLSGASNSVPITVSSSDGVTNLSVTIAVPESVLTNLSVLGTAPTLAAATLSDKITNIVMTLSSSNGQPMVGALQAARLTFLASNSVAQSSRVTLPILSVTAYKPGGTVYTNYIKHDGSVIVVADKPLLQAGIGTNLAETLVLYGRLGTNYELQFTTNLTSPNWQPLQDYTQTSSVMNLTFSNSARIIFYRIQQR